VYELQYSGAVNVKWFGAVGDGVADDSSAIALAIAALTTGAKLIFNESTAYLLSSTLEIFNKPRTNIDFNKQLIYANGAIGIHFKGMSQSVIDNIFVIGSGTNTGVDFKRYMQQTQT
jgi:polygalacturonase